MGQALLFTAVKYTWSKMFHCSHFDVYDSVASHSQHCVTATAVSKTISSRLEQPVSAKQPPAPVPAPHQVPVTSLISFLSL